MGAELRRASPRLPSRREPRLVLWFVVATALGLLLAGGGILVVVERELTGQAERHAVDRARVVTTALLDRQLRASDLAGSPSRARRRELSALFSRTSLGAHSRGATLYGSAGVVFTTAGPARRAVARERVQRALDGHVVSDVVPAGSGRVLRAFVPLVLGGGRVRGAIELDQEYAPIAAAARRSSLLIAAVLEGLLALLCVLVVPVLGRAAARLRRQVRELDWMASHDGLTGLLNRPGFRRVIDDRPGGANESAALVLFDLDRFHDVNETIGADKGDELLVQVAARVLEGFPGRPVARLGEDEFGLLVPAVSDDAAHLAAQRLLDVLVEPLSVDGFQLGLAARVGIARVVEGLDFESLLRRAGVALTAAKEDGREIALYSVADDHRDLGRITAAAELREAIRSAQLRVHYQPQADIAAGSICGVEALVRWQHPGRGLLAAGEFIAAAERSGIVTQISRFVFAAAISQWEQWSRHGIRLDLAINLAAIDLLDISLPREIATLLAQHDMPPERLVLEITERTLLQDERQARNVLTQLNDIGVRVSIDDYGTGYSSLASLRQLPFQQVKIDRCFVTGIPADAGNDAIVGSTIDLAHALGAAVVAEGIENRAELDRLAELGCDIAQGYLVGRPLPPDELERLVLRRRADEPARTPVAIALAGAWER